MVRMDQVRVNKRIFDRIREYKSVGGYVKQMREETEKLKITDKNCLDKEQYGSKGTQKWWEDTRIREKQKWERPFCEKKND